MQLWSKSKVKLKSLADGYPSNGSGHITEKSSKTHAAPGPKTKSTDVALVCQDSVTAADIDSPTHLLPLPTSPSPVNPINTFIQSVKSSLNMVFIVIAAAKAAKMARDEQTKKKKRQAMITPCEGSRDAVQDNAVGGSSMTGEGADTWYGAPRACAVSAPETETMSGGNGISVWSRNACSDTEHTPTHRRSFSQSSSSEHGSQVLAGVMDARVGGSSSEPVVREGGRNEQRKPDEREVENERAKKEVRLSSEEEKDAQTFAFEDLVVEEGSSSKPKSKVKVSKPPRKPKPVEGSFEAAVREDMKKPVESSVQNEGAKEMHVEADKNGVVDDDGLRKRKEGNAQMREKKVEVDGSFEAALKKGTSKRTPAAGVGAESRQSKRAPKGDATDGSSQSAVQPDGSFEAALKKGLSKRAPGVSVGMGPEERKAEPKGEAEKGSFQSAMQKGGSLRKMRSTAAVQSTTEKEQKGDTFQDAMESALRKQSGLRRKPSASVPVESGIQEGVSAMAYPAGSKLRRAARSVAAVPSAASEPKLEQPMMPATEMVPQVETTSEVVSAPGESCMRAEGTMKRRLTRRQ